MTLPSRTRSGSFLRPILRTLLIILTSVLLSWIMLSKKDTISLDGSGERETAYERVMRTHELRCGYINYPPHTIIDPSTKQMTGLMHDIAEEMGRLLDLKIVWAEEVGWGNTVEALKTQRVDAICTSFWQNPVEGRYVSFTMPLFYSAVTAYTKATDTRFDGQTPAIFNTTDMRISSTDGAMAGLIAAQDFPKAKVLAAPNMMDESHLLMDVAAGKADVTFVESYIGAQFMKNNPKQVKAVFADKPLRVFGNTIALPANEPQLKSMLDSALVQMLNGGFVDHVIERYENVPNAILRVARPYEPIAKSE